MNICERWGRVCGYHVYNVIWTAVNNEILRCERDSSNLRDRYAVAVMKNGTIVDHLPMKVSCVCSLLLRSGWSITCTVVGTRRYSLDLPQGGMEIPC
jgi:hypothetical protein